MWPPCPTALARALVRRPPRPADLASLLDGTRGAPGFRRVVAAIFPDGVEAIMAADDPGLGRAGARVAAFLERVERECFPVYEADPDDADAYDAVLAGIPFQRFGWGDEDLHALTLRPGYLLLLALCADPYDAGAGVHPALLDALTPLVPRPTLRRLPPRGLAPGELRARLAGSRLEVAADFCAWVHGDTDNVFLDYDDTVDIADAHWTREIVDELTAQWRRAEAILTGIDALAAWLEVDPPARYAALLDVALGPTPALVPEAPVREPRAERTDDGDATATDPTG
ncbi:MAG TPA: hypothetical protein VFW96_07515 [Thermomicrobiales bacterium]|nr:hypothetical protein [Thermomicrobiales bacterium]